MTATPTLDQGVRRNHDLRNLIHTIIMVAGSALLVGVIAYTVMGTTGLITAAIFTAMGLLGLRRMSPAVVLNLYKARPLSSSEAPELHRLVGQLSERAGLPATPKLYYVPSKILNAFAVGRPEESAIAVTDGLLRAMSMRQLAGILAHETAHVRNGDLKVMGLADVLNRATSFMSQMGLFGLPMVFGVGLNLPITGLLLLLAAPTIGSLLQLSLSRAREYDADLDGAGFTGDPEGLALALRDLEAQQSRGWEGVVLPGSRLPQPSLLRTHPKTQDRIDRLMALAGQGSRQITVAEDDARPEAGFTPVIRNPRIQWQRLGIYS
jgi:heat shock protein HtpX